MTPTPTPSTSTPSAEEVEHIVKAIRQPLALKSCSREDLETVARAAIAAMRAQSSDGAIYRTEAFGRLPISQADFDGLERQLGDLLAFINGLAVRLDIPSDVHMADPKGGHLILQDWIVERQSSDGAGLLLAAETAHACLQRLDWTVHAAATPAFLVLDATLRAQAATTPARSDAGVRS